MSQFGTSINIAINSRNAVTGGQAVANVFGKIIGSAESADRSLRGVERRLSSLAAGASTAAAAMSRFLITLSAGIAIRTAIKSFADFESGVIAVKKTTNLAGTDLETFSKAINTLSLTTPIATTELLDIAAAAGQLGIRGTADLLKFTDTVARLGVSTDLKGAEAATTLARILNVTGEPAANIAKLGAVIVALGNNFAATESEIAGVARYVGLATSSFKVTSAEVTGLSAAMAALGVRAELSGFAVGKTLRAIDTVLKEPSKKRDLLATIFREPVKDLQAQFESSPIQVFQKFLQALAALEEQGTNTAAVLENLGLRGEEIAKVLPTLATRYDSVAKALGIARKEFGNPQALVKESDQAYGSFNSQMKILKNTIDSVTRVLSAEYVPQLRKMVEWLKTAIQSADGLAFLNGLVKGLAIALGAIVAIRIVAFLGNTVVAVYDLIKAMITLLPVILAVTAALAAIEIARYFYDEFQSVREYVDEFRREWEVMIEEVKFLWASLMAYLDKGWDGFKVGSSRAVLAVEAHILEMQRNLIGGAMGPILEQETNRRLAEINRIQAGGESDVVEKARKDLADANAKLAIYRDSQNNPDRYNHDDSAAIYARLTRQRDQAQPIVDEANRLKGVSKDIDAEIAKLTEQRNLATLSIDQYYDVVALARNREFDGKDRKGGSVEDFVTGDLNKIQSSIKNWITQLGTLGPEADKARQELLKLLNGAGDSPILPKQLDEARDALDVVSQHAEEARERIRKLFREINSEIGVALSPEVDQQVARQLETLREIQKDAAYSPEVEAQQNKLLEQKVRQLYDLNRLSDVLRTVGETGAQAFEDIALNAKNAGDVIKDTLKAMEQAAFKYLFTQPLSQAFQAGLGSLFGGAVGSGGEITSGGANVIPAASGATISFGSGGMMGYPTTMDYGNRRVLAGETGYETYMPAKRMPNGDIGVQVGGGGGSSITLVQNISTPNADSFRASGRQIMADAHTRIQGAFSKR